MRKTLRPTTSRRYPQLCISTVVGTPVASTSGLRVLVTAIHLLAGVALLSACASAHAQRTRSAADRLRITAEHQQRSLKTGAVATVTGIVARPAEDTTLPLELYTARVLLTALPRTRHCPRSAPRPDPPHSTHHYFYEMHFRQVLAIADASEVAHKLRQCGYLTAKRRTPSGVRTVTVARASTTVSGAGQRNSTDEPSLAVRIITLTLFGWLLVGLIRLVKWWIHDTPAARKARRAATARRLLRLGRSSPTPPPAPPAPSYAVPASPPAHSAPTAAAPQPTPVQTERPRRRAKPRDVVLDAVDAVADAYRDRLQNILEHQDGPRWLDAFNHRRAASFIQDGKPAPRPYDSLEPRAVLTCLARDPAGLQLISEPATVKARQLSGLVNDAVHPKPHAPLTEADGYRAWRLYTDITGIVPVGDPFER
jgi:pyruvate/2-oxoglutarate dehydrogenase complex dihydrolipoamide acyltransferase (E2) component